MNYLRLGLIDESAGILRSFLELNDLSPEINYNLGQIYNSKNDLGNALRYAWRATELKKDFCDAFDLCGSVFFKLEDFENSVRLYKQSVDIDPDNAMGHFNLGCAYSAAGDFERAEAHWKNAIYYEGKVKITKETEEKKGEGLQIAVTVMKRPVSFDAHKALGRHYLRLKLKSQALQEFLEAIELEPSDSEPYYEVGMILLEQDEREKAVEYFERYLYLGGKKVDEVKAILKKIKKR
jgi:tetratricopeptide (TPR) repeat protein